MTDRVELAQNAAARAVPSMVNGKPQIPYLGIGKYQPRVRKPAPPVRSSKDYPENGDKRLPDLESALRWKPPRKSASKVSCGFRARPSPRKNPPST